MALLTFEFDFFLKSCRHFIGILAWTWAIFVFCLSYIGRSNSYNNNDHYYLNNRGHNGADAPSLYRTVFLPILKVLLVAPSASLALPVAQDVSTTQAPPGGVSSEAIPSSPPTPQNAGAQSNGNNLGFNHPVVIPWGPGLAVGAQGPGQGAPLGGFIYCAGCSPLNPGQLVLPTNVPWNKALEASGVLPPQIAAKAAETQKEGGFTLEQELNGLGGGEEPGKGQRVWDDGGIPVQQMALHDDGRYSFSYNTAHASRQEERNLDGAVSGSYSYTDPEGKLVQIDYTAGPNMGYQAYGENVPPQPVLQLPQPVQDTLEVQIARQQFLDTYNRELERIQRDQEAAAAKAATATPEGLSSTTPSSSEITDESSTDSPQSIADDSVGEGSDDDAVIVSGKTENEGEQDVAGGQDDEPQPVAVDVRDGITTDEQADSIVISAKGSGEDRQNPVQSSLPSPAYQITIPIGVGGNAGLSLQQSQGSEKGGARNDPEESAGNSNAIGQGQQDGAKKSNLQPYFYYVSVGGQPHYVTSNSQTGYISPYPTSLKASLLGAMPLAAVHDAQVPNRQSGGEGQSNTPASTRPIFLDLENGLKLDQQQQQQAPQQSPQIINPASLFVLNNQNQQNPLGQLVPLGIGNGASFGYIPALILNNNGAQQQQQQQSSASQGSQNQNVPLPNQMQMHGSPNLQIPTLNNQPIILLASKK